MASPDASASLSGSPTHTSTSLLPGLMTPQNTNFIPELRNEDDDVFLATPQDPNVQRTMGLQLPRVKPTPDIRDPVAEKRNSAATRARTATAAPAGTSCVLTREPNAKGGTVQAAHAIPRSWQKSVPDRIRNIEYHLGFPKAKMLNLDTRWNVMFLLVIYHLFYDHDGFIFLPSMAVIDAIYAYTLKNRQLAAAKQKLVFYLTAFPTPPGGWQYSVVPVKMSTYHSIFRKTWRKVERDGKTEYEETAKYQRFKYPFDTLPLAHIHVNPCLMIISAWKTINKLPSHTIWTRDQKLAIQNIRWIVNDWISASPSDFQADPRVDRPFAHPRRAHNARPPAASNTNAVAGPSTLPSTRQKETNDENAAAGPSSQPAAMEENSDNGIPLRRSKRKPAVSDGNEREMATQASKRAHTTLSLIFVVQLPLRTRLGVEEAKAWSEIVPGPSEKKEKEKAARPPGQRRLSLSSFSSSTDSTPMPSAISTPASSPAPSYQTLQPVHSSPAAADNGALNYQQMPPPVIDVEQEEDHEAATFLRDLELAKQLSEASSDEEHEDEEMKRAIAASLMEQ